jgi:hypothetical protein
MIDYERALKSGLGLKVVERMSDRYQVYKVRGPEGLMVAKLSPRSPRQKRASHYLDLEQEKNMLTRAHNPLFVPLILGIIRVPGLRGFYYGLSEFFLLPEGQATSKGNVDFYVLLRDYIQGNNLGEDKLLDQAQGRRFRETISGLHLAGICSFDLSPDNIRIERKTKIPYLVELAHCLTQEDLEDSQFEQACVSDLEEVDRLCVA